MRLEEQIKNIADREQIPVVLKQHNLFNKVCEVGVNVGNQFRYYYSFNPEILVGVDLFKGKWGRKIKDLSVYMETIQKDCPKSILEKGISWKIANKYQDNYFDFVYIDANHKYKSIKKDLDAWFPKVKKGGVLAGHDYTARRGYGVIQAVTKFAAKYNCPVYLTTSGTLTQKPWKSWIIVV